MIINGIYTGALLISVIISSISQIILKQSADQKHKNIVEEYLNPKMVFAYILFIVSTLLATFSYRAVPLSVGSSLEATGYFWVAILDFLFLKESITQRKWMGLGMILFGVLIFNL